jgi:uncharacterized protein
MKSILIAGGSGLIGQRLTDLLSKKYEVRILSRSKRENKGNVKYYQWDPMANEIDPEALDSHILINLAGGGIADKRWTSSRKKELIDSRTIPTDLIANHLKKNKLKPMLYIGASAIGFYGDKDDEVLTEASKVGEGFLADCCVQWEGASRKIEPLVDRFILLRIGVVLSKKGGALPKLLMTSSFGLLNYFGDGSMYYSWIHIDDICGIVEVAIDDNRYTGIINAVAPEPLQNKDFVKEISKGLPSSKLVISAPALAIKLALGEMSAVVLNSNRVLPTQLQKWNYQFKFMKVSDSIRDLVERGV